jgi:hypothetical protein
MGGELMELDGGASTTSNVIYTQHHKNTYTKNLKQTV